MVYVGIPLQPDEELGHAVDLIVVSAIRKGKKFHQKLVSQGASLGKWRWPASIFADPAVNRSALLPSGLTPIGRVMPDGLSYLRSCSRLDAGAGVLDQHRRCAMLVAMPITLRADQDIRGDRDRRGRDRRHPLRRAKSCRPKSHGEPRSASPHPSSEPPGHCGLCTGNSL